MVTARAAPPDHAFGPMGQFRDKAPRCEKGDLCEESGGETKYEIDEISPLRKRLPVLVQNLHPFVPKAPRPLRSQALPLFQRPSRQNLDSSQTWDDPNGRGMILHAHPILPDWGYRTKLRESCQVCRT